MPLVVRPAQPPEYDAVGRLTLAAYTANGYIVEDDFYAAHLLDAAGRAKDGELLVAELDGSVVGTVTFCPEGSRFREVGRAGEGEFRMLAVDPRSRRVGAAATLVGRVLDRSRELGYGAVVLSSLPVQVEAHALYRRLGFERVPERDWSPVPGVDLIGFRVLL
jgi:predicted N-acetyltransferase YhbS